MATGRRNLSVSLSSDSVTPDYRWDTYDEPELYDEETITYFDRSANASTTEYSYSGKENGDRLYQCSGVEANYYLFNCRISYKLYWTYNMGWYPPQLEDHIQEIAEALHLGHSVHGRNFYVACDEFQVEQQAGSERGRRYETHEGTVSELLDRLIGWSRDIPMLQYSVRITGNSLVVYQRGYENNTVNLDTTGKLRRDPTYTVRSIYTTWNSGGGYIYSSDRTLTKAPFTGTLSFGLRSLTYQDGYLITEVNGDTTTTFTYGKVGNSDGKYLMSKTVTSEDDTVVTSYVYQQTTNEVYLSEETETHYSGSGSNSETDSIIVTTHTPLGNGWYGTTTYDKTDGENEVLSTSMGQGAPGGKVSQYMVDSQQEGLTNNADINDRRVAILGLARLRSTYPVHDVATLRRIASAIDNYNGCTEYTVTLDVYNLTTVVDIDTLVTLDNKTWYVQRNNVEITPMHKLQRLMLVRWEV